MNRFFTVAERERAQEAILSMAHADPVIVAGAVIGSLAQGPGDRWSDLDLGFGLRDGTSASDVLATWTPRLAKDFGAAHLFDVPFRSSLYRVFLFPGNLQVDLSLTPAAEFGALGPKFRLLFGQAVERAPVPPPSAHYLFGLGVHHAVRARVCIERGKLWQAEYWVSGVRDQALALACHNRGLETSNGRGYDLLPAEVLSDFGVAIVRSIERSELLRALDAAINRLLGEASEIGEVAVRLGSQLRELVL
jgi:hypothetical protein